MTQLAREVIIEPMLELFLPPRHLRANPEARKRALDAYETALAPFDRATLKQGWEKVVAEQTFWVWPNPGTIAEACRQFRPRPKPLPEDEQPRAKALQMAEAHTLRYMKTSQLARLAKKEGWAGQLRHYVADAAWLQAQLICHVHNIGWNPQLADDLGSFHLSQDAFDAYRKTAEKGVKRGHIEVRVPPTLIRQWKEQHRPEQKGENREEGRATS